MLENSWAMVDLRRHYLARFLAWAGAKEDVASLRLARRQDIQRVRQILHEFSETWWAAVVYSCFDSVLGAREVATAFDQPMDSAAARRVLDAMDLPLGSVGGHRTQPAHRGAKIALVAACEHATAFQNVLMSGSGFHDRYLQLRRIGASQWGRTTCYDLLVRTGQLGIGSDDVYEPDRAYLADSTGPQRGFELLWGIKVTRSNVDECEELLRWWSSHWDLVADTAGVTWSGRPYGPGDFENALCIYQERGNPGYGNVPRELPDFDARSSVAEGVRQC